MTTATFRDLSAAERAASERKGWFQRLLGRLIEARMRQAEHHVREHLGIAPELAEQAAFKEAVGTKWTLPFVRGA
ncbi:MAG: hypothetical protein IRZ09_13830 [Variibacter sp.]|nr:hypothetical protein [Variibacter sp.]